MSIAQPRLLKYEAKSPRTLEIAADWKLDTFELRNRRYLGGKSKLLQFIDTEIYSVLGRYPKSIFDVFAGTGVVANHFATKGVPVIANDLLKHNYFGLLTFLGPQRININSLAEKLTLISQQKPVSNYFSEHFGNTYFSELNAMKIGTFREKIDEIAKSLREKAALITSLIYAADKVANTVGHYDAFHRGQDNQMDLELKLPLIENEIGIKNEVYCHDSVALAPNVSSEVAYLDPPYNSRQYSDAYHLLENLAAWEKPEVHGIARKMNRAHLKSDFCGKDAPEAFDNLINRVNADLIVVSYNNTSAALNARSNASISDDELIGILEARGKVTIREVKFNGFTAGKTKKRKHTERLFLCVVKKK